MQEYIKIKNIVENSYEAIKKQMYNNEFKLSFISENINEFDINLNDNYGVSKNEIVNHVLFEIYAQIVQEKIYTENKNKNLKEMLSIFLL